MRVALLYFIELCAARLGHGPLPRPGESVFGLRNIIYDEERDVGELMQYMDLEGWNVSDFRAIYNELLVNFVPDYRPAPPPASTLSQISQPGSSRLTPNPALDEDIFTMLFATADDKPKLKQSTQSANTEEPAGSNLTEEDREFMMRYLQLKYSILFLQKQKFIGKFCFYGCWCLPNGAGDLGAGTGPPVDNIDKSCREYTTCYNCMYNDGIGGVCDDQKVGRYNIAGRQHANGQIFLMCVDEAGSCERQRCECDRSLAEKLSQYEAEWNQSHHRRWGEPVFDWEQNCQKKSYHSVVFGTPQPAIMARSGFARVGLFQDETIADGSFRESELDPELASPYQRARSADISNPVQRTIHLHNHSPPIYGPIVGCCGRVPNVHYFREGQKCCPDGSRIDNRQQCL